MLSGDAPVLFVSVAITEQDVGERADSHLDRIQLARADVLVSATPRSPTASRRPPASPSRQTLSFLLLALVKEIPVFSADGLPWIGAEMEIATAPSAATVQTALKRLQKRDLAGSPGHGKWAMEDIALESYIRRTFITPEQVPDSNASDDGK